MRRKLAILVFVLLDIGLCTVGSLMFQSTGLFSIRQIVGLPLGIVNGLIVFIFAAIWADDNITK